MLIQDHEMLIQELCLTCQNHSDRDSKSQDTCKKWHFVSADLAVTLWPAEEEQEEVTACVMETEDMEK